MAVVWDRVSDADKPSKLSWLPAPETGSVYVDATSKYRTGYGTVAITPLDPTIKAPPSG